MLRSLLLLLLVSFVLPATAAADDIARPRRLRQRHAARELHAGSGAGLRDAAGDTGGRPRAMRGDRSGRVRDLHHAGRDQLCDIAVTAQPRVGWAFRRWAPESNHCAGATNPVCTFRTREIDCDDTGERCTVNEPGPFRHDRGVRGHARADGRVDGPRADEPIVFDDARQAGSPSGAMSPRRRRRSGAGATTGRRRLRSPHTLLGVPDGLHTFCVTATDASGGPSDVPACRAWRQETHADRRLLTRRRPRRPRPRRRSPTPPTRPDSPLTARRSSFECRLDAGAFEACHAEGVGSPGSATGGTSSRSGRPSVPSRAGLEPAGDTRLDRRHGRPGDDDHLRPARR